MQTVIWVKLCTRVFHRTVQQIFEGIECAKVYINVILTQRRRIEKPDHRLKRALERARAIGLKLNKQKYKFWGPKYHLAGRKTQRTWSSN